MAPGAAAFPAPPRSTTASICLLAPAIYAHTCGFALAALCLLHRLCNPIKMSGHERRNELDLETAGASLEYLVYGKYGVKEDDKGFWDTKWWALGNLLEQVTADDVQEAIEAWQEAEEAAREGLLALAAEAAPAEA